MHKAPDPLSPVPRETGAKGQTTKGWIIEQFQILSDFFWILSDEFAPSKPICSQENDSSLSYLFSCKQPHLQLPNFEDLDLTWQGESWDIVMTLQPTPPDIDPQEIKVHSVVGGYQVPFSLQKALSKHSICGYVERVDWSSYCPKRPVLNAGYTSKRCKASAQILPISNYGDSNRYRRILTPERQEFCVLDYLRRCGVEEKETTRRNYRWTWLIHINICGSISLYI